MKKTLLFLCTVIMVLLIGCPNPSGSGDPNQDTLSSDKELTDFSFEAVNNATLSIDVTALFSGTDIYATVPYGTDVTSLVATFTARGKSVTIGSNSQTSGITSNDFTGSIIYIVTAEDGTIQNYTVVVTVAANTAKEITAFSFEAANNGVLSIDVTAEINGTEISATVPYGTDVTALVATFATTGASVTVGGVGQTSGTTANDFTDSVTYTVTAGDGTTQNYTVVVIEAANDAKEITAFSFEAAKNGTLSIDVTAEINGTEISATVPYGTDVTALVATFATTGASVTVGGVGQTSGTTANDFTDSVTYTVTAEDGTTRNYMVSVAVPAAVENSGFSGASNPGDVGVLILTRSSETLNMIYANNKFSMTFPLRQGDTLSATLDKRFFIGETEVTNAVMVAVLQWAYDNGKFSDNIGDHNGINIFTAKYGGQQLVNLKDAPVIDYDGAGNFSYGSSYRADYPAVRVTWYGAVMFCNWLTEMRDGNTNNVVYTGITTSWEHDDTIEDTSKNGYRLPSGGFYGYEWEYSARYINDANNDGDILDIGEFYPGDHVSGDTSSYCFPDDGGTSTVFGDYAWYGGNTIDDDYVRVVGTAGIYVGNPPLHTPRTGNSNALGLYDMSGNVWEWCFPGGSTTRRYRGASFSEDNTQYLQIGAGGRSDFPWEDSTDVGFRLCRTAD